METNFKFNSQICTTKEQSERLLALGLKKETADMYYPYFGKNSEGDNMYYLEPSVGRPCGYDIPAWSLHRLLELMNLDFHTGGHYIIFDDTEFMDSKNIYDNLCDCFEWLIKEGYFNKEYLEE